MSEPIVELKDICASYGSVPVLHNINLAVPKGKILGVVGESGSGKSTMARVIAGLLAPSSGYIEFEGAALGRARGKDIHRKIQMVFQNPDGSLNPRHTIGRTLTDSMRFHGIASGAEAKALSAEWMARMALPPDSCGRYPSSFSGGQKQRIALARALCVRPSLLIADEPTSALDVSVQLSMLDLIRELQREQSLTVVFISHDLGVIRYLCDEVAVMRGGKIEEQESAKDFFAAPRTAYGRELLQAVPSVVVA